MKPLRILLAGLVLAGASHLAHAQKKPLIFEHEKVVEAARADLDQMLSKDGPLTEEAAKMEVRGEYIMDLTIAGKGKVLSVYMVASDADEIPMQNRAKDLMRRIRFNFKMPKDKTYKFQYTFQFD